MSQTDLEQQLRIWKDLAISKQMLMNEAAAALKLREDVSADELRDALDAAIKRSRDADEHIKAAQAQAEQDIESMRREVRNITKAKSEADHAREAAVAAQETAEKQLENGRRENAEQLKKAKRLVEDKQKELKAINTALNGTPDDVLKKLRTLKKKKLDEAKARQSAEEQNRKLKKQNKEQSEKIESLDKLGEHSATLLAAYRELRQWVDTHAAQLAGQNDVPELPSMDETVLASIDTMTAEEHEEHEDKREAATA